MKQQHKIKPTKLKKKEHSHSNFPYYWLLALVVIIAITAYSNIFKCDFLNFDDREYFTAYPEITNINFSSIKAYFSNYYVAMYQPLPVLSFALTYKFFQLNPVPYHLINLVFHVFNIIMVFMFVKKLSDNKSIALFTAFIFALHPMNVESVTWISARSSGMFVFFYLTALYYYLKYVKEGKKTYDLALVLLFFLLSLFSKAQAVTLPLIIVAVDYYLKRKFNLKLIAEKLPFFVLSLIFGIVAIMQQGASESTFNIHESFSLIDKFFLITYAISFYIVRLFFPFNLSGTYLFPVKEGAFLPLEFYAASLLLLTVIILVFVYHKRKPYILFGLAFFLLSLSLTLQILPTRWIITADRYAYLPFIGLLFVIGSLIAEIKSSQTRKFIYLGIALLGLVFAFLTHDRNKVWANNETFWTSAIEHNKNNAAAYNNRGTARNESADNEKSDLKRIQKINDALSDFSKAIALDTTYAEAFYNSGLAKYRLGNAEEAIPDYSKAIALRPKYVSAYNNRGNAYKAIKEFDAAMADFNKVISLNPNVPDVYNNIGALKNEIKEYHAAIEAFTKSIAINNNMPVAYKNRGYSKYMLGDIEGACNDWKKAANLGDKEAQTEITTGVCAPDLPAGGL